MTGIIGKTSRSGIVESVYNGIISSATEPYAASANIGKLWFDSRLEVIRVSDGAKWIPVADTTLFPQNVAGFTGGTITARWESNSYIQVHTFLSSGTLVVPGNCTASVLAVGGGGAGGRGANHSNGGGGGGGGGGVVVNASYSLTAGSHTVTVGDGGTGAYWHSQGPNEPAGSSGANGTAGDNGGFSKLGTVIATGGGGGGNVHTDSSAQGADGADAPTQESTSNGSGGGGAGRTGGGGTTQDGGAAGSSGGYAGGTVTYAGNSGAGGGGAGAAGTGGDLSSGGAGGAGLAREDYRTSSNVTWAAGGAGGTHNGGLITRDATANTGNGGGGGNAQTNSHGGNGGSGIVIVKLLLG